MRKLAERSAPSLVTRNRVRRAVRRLRWKGLLHSTRPVWQPAEDLLLEEGQMEAETSPEWPDDEKLLN